MVSNILVNSGAGNFANTSKLLLYILTQALDVSQVRQAIPTVLSLFTIKLEFSLYSPWTQKIKLVVKYVVISSLFKNPRKILRYVQIH